jgi:hypothetical protein
MEEENINYDQLPVMSPMMASNSNESGNGGHTLMDDGMKQTAAAAASADSVQNRLK